MFVTVIILYNIFYTVSHSGGQHCNYSTEDCTSWPKMVLPTESQAQSPSCLQGTKPSNVDKMVRILFCFILTSFISLLRNKFFTKKLNISLA